MLTAKNIYKSYKTKSEEILVLSDLSLTVQNSEIISIMGPSGAGKSTLLHILGTIDNFDSGNLTINSIEIDSMNDNSKFRSENIGFIFQFHHLLHEFSVIENLIIPQMLLDKDKFTIKEIALELLNELGLIHLKDRFPGQISGGERQRVAVLRALVNQPKLLFADEPTGNLDIENSNKLLELFNTIKDKFKTSIVIATHDEIVKNYSSRNLMLEDGILIES
ncbi:MAG: lipoprotein-releasing system ATP-binding protein LolD [Candidatus Marinimicrobia bacterium]|nr:lipoprotein-releasing system ATP-binding protein LolD [Candidatus Neomarinimicrobiota bacterium]